MTDLNQEEANKLFNNYSAAIRDNDFEKLDTLAKAEAPAEDEELEEQPEVEDEPQETEEPQDDDDTEEEDSPQPTADEDEEQEEPDPMAELKAQLAALEKENHKLKSQAGRVPHVQKRLKELDKKLEELAKNSSPSSQTSTKIQPELDNILKNIKTTDPELAEAIAQAAMKSAELAAEDRRTTEIETLTFLRAQEYSAYEQAEAQRLLEMYPNAPEVFKSKHWSEWMESQTDGIKALANSSHADEVGYAMKKYTEDMLAQYPELAQKYKPAVQNAEVNTQAQKIEEQRRKRKESSASVTSSNAPGKVKMPDDPEALFRKFSKQFEKERTGS